jgi:signal transduction histidine kinase
MVDIYLAITVIFASLLGLLVIINYLIARRVWIPFYKTLGTLRGYEITSEEPLQLPASNIREFVNLNQALEKMSRKIRKDFLTLKEFNENAAHELQTPLAVIKSKTDLLFQDESLRADQLKLISAISEATSRMSKLNQGLLLISKIDNNQFPLTDKVSLGEVVDRTLDHFNEIMTLHGITFSKNYPGTLEVLMNPVLADILVTNLLSNAIKHNLPQGKITISITSGEFAISNTGPELSIDPQLMFERFRKSDHRSESVGLGLSIVRKIAELSGLQTEYRYSGGIHTIRIFI